MLEIAIALALSQPVFVPEPQTNYLKYNSKVQERLLELRNPFVVAPVNDKLDMGQAFCIQLDIGMTPSDADTGFADWLVKNVPEDAIAPSRQQYRQFYAVTAAYATIYLCPRHQKN